MIKVPAEKYFRRIKIFRTDPTYLESVAAFNNLQKTQRGVSPRSDFCQSATFINDIIGKNQAPARFKQTFDAISSLGVMRIAPIRQGVKTRRIDEHITCHTERDRF